MSPEIEREFREALSKAEEHLQLARRLYIERHYHRCLTELNKADRMMLVTIYCIAEMADLMS